MLSFHRLKYSEIPIGENKHRIEYLTLFRDLIYDIRPVFDTQLRVPLSPTTGQPLNKEQRFTEFNERKPLAQQMIALADIKTRREFATRVKGVSSLLEVDVIQQFWDLETLGVSFRAPMDVVEEAIGRYKTDQKNALCRTRNPFFWIVRIVEWIAGFPVWLFSSIFRLDQEKAATSKLGRIVTILFQTTLWLFGLFQTLAALSYLLDHFGWENPVLRWLGFK
jgi:hypothetical protein